ncbi:MAG: utilization substance protein [Dehalococcoidia bacterium]|nr:utilization substance protein [Dehalococcoidia bacterium]
MKSDFLIAVTQLAAERRLPREAIISAIEAALASAYKRDSLLAGQDISVSLNPANGEVKVYTQKTVVEKPEDPQKEISLAEARKYKADAKLEDIIGVECSFQSTGRIAAQTAKQVVLQRLREAERELVYTEYAEKEGDIVTATVQRADSRQVILDLGRAEAVLPLAEQVPTERYRPGQKLKVHVLEVRRTSRGPEILVSRTHKNLLRRLFEMEVPEIHNGVVEIKAVAREAGSRSKVAVYSRQEGVDPVGSCVGLRGIRIQNIVNEIQGEKVDVIQWHPDQAVFLANALSPCPVTRVEIDQQGNEALVVVPDRQLSLAIGREGQNARLCAKLSGLRVSIKSVTEAEEERMQRAAEVALHLKEVAVTPQSTAEEALQPPVPGVEVALKKEVSIEEQLAEAALKATTEVEPGVAGQQEAPELPEVVWAVPQVAQKPQRVRFAEEIMGPRQEEPSPRGSRKRVPLGKGEEEVKAGKRSRRDRYSMDQDGEWEEQEEGEEQLEQEEEDLVS